MRRSIARALLVALTVTAVSACGSDEGGGSGSSGGDSGGSGDSGTVQGVDAATTMDELYQLAKEEGELVLWGAVDKEYIDAVAESFGEEYPGITVDYTEIRASEYIPRIITEAQAGQLSVDGGIASIETSTPLEERDMLGQHGNWQDLVPELESDLVLLDGRSVAVYDNVFPIGYNTDLVQGADVPESWDDLIDPKWQGQLVIDPRAQGFEYYGVTIGEAAFEEYMTKIKAQNPIYVSGATGIAEQLAAGQAPIAFGVHAHRINQFKAEGAPVDWVAQDPTGINRQTLFTLKDAAHPAAILLFEAYLAGPEGSAQLAELNGTDSLVNGGPVLDALEAAGVETVIKTEENTDQLGEMSDLASATLGQQ